MRLRIDLDVQAYEALADSARNELRPPQMQAEVLLRRALGLPIPKETPSNTRVLVGVGVSND